MTEEQLEIIRSLLTDYDKFCETAARARWVKTERQFIGLLVDDYGMSVELSSIGFVKGYVSSDFSETFAVMMLTEIALSMGWDPEEMWEQMCGTYEKRLAELTDKQSIQVYFADHLIYDKVPLTESDVFKTQKDITDQVTGFGKWQKDFVLPDNVKALLAEFSDVKFYEIGAPSNWITVSDWRWLALKDDRFLSITYFGGWD